VNAQARGDHLMQHGQEPDERDRVVAVDALGDHLGDGHVHRG
jgi:hypothetical protein